MASILGALWGFGHSTGQLLLGLAMVILKDRFQQIVPTLNKWGTTTVGLTLIAIGILGVIEARHQETETEQLQPITPAGALVPTDLKPDIREVIPKPVSKGTKYNLGIFITGIVYGLQPDALFVIIPALTLPTKLAAATYTLMFVFGTCAAMGGYTAVIAGASHRLPDSINSRLALIASGVALCVGLGILLSSLGVAVPSIFAL
jgi:hypothetical protein